MGRYRFVTTMGVMRIVSYLIRPISRIPLLLLSIFLLSCNIADARQDTLSDTLTAELDPIEVKATYSSITSSDASIALTVKNRSQQDLNTNPALTLDEISYDIPGLWVNNRHNYSLGQRITIRGMGWSAAFGVRGIQVLMDGIPLTTADGQTVTNIIDPAFVRDIEVLRGPSSTFWGNSSGGVLYLSTSPSLQDSTTLRTRSLTGSYGLFKQDAEYSRRWDSHNIHLFGSYMTQNGFRNHSRVKLIRTGLTGRYNINSNSGIKYFGAFLSKPYALNPSSLNKKQAADDPQQARGYFASNNARESALHRQAGATYYTGTPVGTFKITGYGIRRTLTSPLPFAYIDLERWMGGARIILENNSYGVDWQAGISAKYQRDDRINRNTVDGEAGDQLLLDQLETVRNHAGFGRASYSIGRFKFSGGFRYDWLRFEADDHLGDNSGYRLFHSFSPSIGLTYKYDGGHLYTNFSRGFEAPTTTELVNRPSGVGGFNPSISPEHTVGVEAGVRGGLQQWNLTYDLSLYSMQVQNMLIPFQLPESDRVYYRNEGKTQHYGIETRVLWTPQRTLKIGLNYSMLRATFIEALTVEGEILDGKSIPGLPEHRLGGYVRWNFEPITLHIEGRGVDQYPVNSRNTHFNEGYALVDGRISHNGLPIGGGITLVPFAAINNITDTRYNSSIVVNARADRYYEPAPGRNWQAGVTLEFNR